MVNPVNGNGPNKGCQIQSEQLDKSVELTEEHSMEFTAVNAFRAMIALAVTICSCEAWNSVMNSNDR
ncbi:hypothetical protein T12_8901 [Trichinella patagoniensis]|uniref:Uncharacterized protein n=1 Tax=Trichinella patagoniensis TaxID=990121 RepID=A0A0V1AAM7_9BILA|nr:hypothetical protein T12_8901 [Trichinella patagoniensis]